MNKQSLTITNLINSNYVHSDANHCWYTDWITRGTTHILLIADSASRCVLCSLVKSKSLRTNDVLLLLSSAIERFGTPKIFHSDQGTPYISVAMRNYLQEKGIRASVGINPSNHFQNQVMESINRSITSLLNIKKSDRNGVKAFLSHSLDEQRRLVKAAVTQYNEEIRVSQKTALAPGALYDALLHKDTKLAIQTKNGTPTAELVNNHLQATAFSDLLRNRLNALGLAGEQTIDQINKHFYESTKGRPTTLEDHRTKAQTMENALRTLCEEVKQIQYSLTESQQFQQLHFQTDVVGHTATATQLAELQMQHEEALRRLVEMETIIKRQEEEANRVRLAKEEAKQKRLKRKRKDKRDAFDLDLLPKLLSLPKSRIEYINARDRASLLLLVFFGFRVGNLKTISVAQVKELLEKGQVAIRQIKNKSSNRTVYTISRRLRPYFEKHRKDFELWFKHNTTPEDFFGRARENMTRRLNNYFKQVGHETNKVLTSHSCRIRVVTEVYKATDLETARQVAGHASVSTTQIYIRNPLTTREYQSIYNKINIPPKLKPLRKESKSLIPPETPSLKKSLRGRKRPSPSQTIVKEKKGR